jgi:hypothetical protein
MHLNQLSDCRFHQDHNDTTKAGPKVVIRQSAKHSRRDDGLPILDDSAVSDTTIDQPTAIPRTPPTDKFDTGRLAHHDHTRGKSAVEEVLQPGTATSPA